MANRTVDECSPKDGKDAHRAELHAFRKCSADQRRSNNEEHPLKHHEQRVRNRLALHLRDLDRSVLHRRNHAAEKEMLTEVSEIRVLPAERETVSPQSPDDAHQSHQEDTLHQDTDDVLFANKSAVEQGQPRTNHQQDERGRDHHPGSVASVELRNTGDRFGCGCSGVGRCGRFFTGANSGR